MIAGTDFGVLLLAAFLAGAVDAVVGGGGLIQIPALLSVLPTTPVAVLFATNKLAAVVGTFSAALRFRREIGACGGALLPATCAAFVGSLLGAGVVSVVAPQLLKPLVLILLFFVGLYTFVHKGFGEVASAPWIPKTRYQLAGAIFGFLIGFYDGFFGPGTGSFLIFGLVRGFGLDLLRASAAAKVINIATNVAALGYFATHDGVLWRLGLAMAVANLLGAQLGVWIALRFGNALIRIVLLLVVSVLIVKLGWDFL